MDLYSWPAIYHEIRQMTIVLMAQHKPLLGNKECLKFWYIYRPIKWIQVDPFSHGPSIYGQPSKYRTSEKEGG